MSGAAFTFLVGLTAVGAAVTLVGCTGPDARVSPSASTPAPTVTAAPTAAADPTPADGDRCEDRFTAEIQRGGDPAAPNTAYIVVTNTGDTACSLSGFPSESAFLSSSGPVTTVGYEFEGAPTADAYERAGEVVTVQPGARAYIWARFARTADRAADDPCELPVAVIGVTLKLPGASAPVVAAAQAEVCVDADVDDLQVGPVDSEPRPASDGG